MEGRETARERPTRNPGLPTITSKVQRRETAERFRPVPSSPLSRNLTVLLSVLGLIFRFYDRSTRSRYAGDSVQRHFPRFSPRLRGLQGSGLFLLSSPLSVLSLVLVSPDLSVSLCPQLSACPLISLLPPSTFLSVSLSLYTYLYPSAYLSIRLSIYVYIFRFNLCLSRTFNCAPSPSLFTEPFSPHFLGRCSSLFPPPLYFNAT